MVEVPEARERLWHANRVRMQEEWQAMTDGVRSLADRAKSFASIASSAAVLVAGLMSTLWLAFRSRVRDQKDK